MAKKYHLDSISEADGTTIFTLVFEDAKNFFVEERHRSRQPVIEQVIQNIPPSEFAKHQVKGVSLIQLVATKLKEPQNFN